MAKLTVRDLNVRGKRVFVRVDYNVPLEERDGQMVITDDTRIRASVPTIKYLVDQGAKVILCSHLGRPKGKDDKLRLNPVAVRLSELLGKPVKKVDDCIGPEVEAAVASGRKRVISFFDAVRVRYVAEDELRRFDPELRSFSNINTPDDLERARAIASAS